MGPCCLRSIDMSRTDSDLLGVSTRRRQVGRLSRAHVAVKQPRLRDGQGARRTSGHRHHTAPSSASKRLAAIAIRPIPSRLVSSGSRTDSRIGHGFYGVRKVHTALAREGGVVGVDGVDGGPMSRRLVERLMRAAGLQGARRSKRFTTTNPHSPAPRPPRISPPPGASYPPTFHRAGVRVPVGALTCPLGQALS